MPSAPWFAMALAVSQGGASILHEPISCIAPGDYPVVKALIEPDLDVRSAKVYFRSDKYPKFYFVGMSPEAGTYTSVLPRPSGETARIVYYIEAVDTGFTNVVGAEHVLEVRPDCAVVETDSLEEPAITVGAVEAGAPSLPPGFETAGIIGTIASTGALTGLGGGSGIGTAAVVGGLAAGAGGAAVAATTGASEEPLPPPGRSEAPAPTPSTPPPSSPAPSPSPADPTPAPPPSAPPPPTTPPPSPPPTTPTPPPAPPSAPPPPPAPSAVAACFTASFPGMSCNLKLDSSCSQGSILSWDWVIEAGPALGGTTTHASPTVNRNFPQCSGETVQVTLTVTGAGGATSSTYQSVKLPVRLTRLSDDPRHCVLSSLLSTSGSRGSVVLDGVRADAVEGAIPGRHDVLGSTGEREVEAFVVAGSAAGTWSFDFSRCEGLAPGSLAPISGSPMGADAIRIVFRIDGTPGERIAFRYRLSP